MAVYTRLSEEVMKNLLDEYPLGRIERVHEIPEGILNTNYLIEGSRGRHILRILEGRRDVSEELKELENLRYLSKNGFPCPVPLKTSDERDCVFVGDKMASVFTFIEGEKVEIIDEISIREIGRRLGQMHKLLVDRDIIRTRKIDMDYFYDLICQKDMRKILGKDHDRLMGYYRRAVSVDYSGLPHGIIHNDIFPDNVFMREGKISGVIDFNDSMRGPLILDLAIVINFWIRGRGFATQKEEHLQEVLLDAYGEERRLEYGEVLLLDEAVLKSALTFIFLRINKFHVEENHGVNMEHKDYRDLMPLLDYF